MAADWLSCLPSAWTYGVRRDGRIFFINEQTQSTTWLHPVSGEAVVTGHRKTADLPTGWEEGYTFEGARCFINHNERKVTCKHPLSGAPSQDNCIFVVNEQPAAPSAPSQNVDRRDRPTSLLSETHTAGSDHSPTTSISTATSPCPGPNGAPQQRNSATAAGRPSRSSKKIHNFGKRSNSIKRNANAPVVKRGWLYKQDSTGMKLWKKRWFVLCDMCLFYYRDEKEDSILGSILLPSFHISMLSVDDHISRKYAFKATHSNMRTYYFCTDSAKDSESWMEVLTDAALVHTEPRSHSADHLIDNVNVDVKKSEELNNQHNQRTLTCPEIQNNQRNRDNHPDRQRHRDNRLDHPADCYTLHRDGDSLVVKKDGVSYTLQKHGDKYVLHKDGEMFLLRRNGERFSLQKDEPCALHNNNSTVTDQTCALHNHSMKKKHTTAEDGPKLLPVKDAPPYATHTLPAHPTEGQRYVPVKEVRRQLSLRETDRSTVFGNNKYGTIHVVDRYGTLKEVKKYATLRDGDRYATLRDVDMYDLHRDGSTDRAQNIQVPASRVNLNITQSLQNTSESSDSVDQPDGSSRLLPALPTDCTPAPAHKTGLSRTHSMPPMEPWARPYRPKADVDTTSICSYQTLPRNMPSHRSQITPRYPEGYRTLPRNSLVRSDSVCTGTDKRRTAKDDTMWQLYEWQQRQAYSRLSMATPTGGGHYGTLPTSKTMSHLREHMATPLPPSSSHGSIYSTLPPPRLMTPKSPHSELSSPLPKEGSLTLGRQKPLPHKMGIAERISVAGLAPHDITPQSLQGKTSEELTLLLIKLRRQQAELSSLRQHTLSQLRALGSEGPNAKMIPETLKTMVSDGEEPDIDTKLSRLCEQDKVVRTQEEKVQQLHREKHTLETALLSASQELSEQGVHTAHTHNLLQQRDVLQGGLLSTCRELGRVTAELQLSRQEYQRLEGDVSQAKARLLQQLEALGSPQTEPPSQRHIQIQKELWRIQDVMEALAKTQTQTQASTEGFPSSKPLSSISKSEGPDYRLYKSEPELTTVKEEEPDEPHPPEERGGVATERREIPVTKVTPCPVGIVPPRTKNTLSPPESSTIACYVTLRKKKPEPRAERPHSALDPAGGFGDREPGRVRMSVEEQLERIRRNQEACTLRRSKLSRSASFNRDQSPGPGAQQQSGPQPDSACTAAGGLEAALQRLKEASEGGAPALEQVVSEEGGGGDSEVTQSDDMKECERQTAVILEVPQPQVKMVEVPQSQVKMVEVPQSPVKMVEVSAQPHAVKVIEVQPFEDLSSSANSPSENSLQTPEPQWSPDQEESGDLSQDSSSELHLLLPAQPMTLVSSDT